jgi:hypothetical protein
MNTTVAPRARAIGLAAAALSLSFGGAAQAITDTIFKYSTPKTGYLTLMPAAFTPRSLDFNYSLSNGYLRATTANITCFAAPVNLPQYAKMTSITMFYTLTSPDAMTLSLEYHVLAGGAGTVVSDSPPATGGYPKWVNIPITNASLQTVDNAHNGYYFDLCMQTTHNSNFNGARMNYTYTNAGD